MHHIQSAAIPPVVETAVSGVSTPSSIGFVSVDDGPSSSLVESIDAGRLSVECDTKGCTNDVYRPGVYRRCRECQLIGPPGSPGRTEAPGRFLVEWKNAKGQARHCGKVSGGISPESVVRLWGTLSRAGVTVITVTRLS